MSGHNIIPDFGTMVSAGYIPGLNYINKFGFNSDIDTTSDPEDVWDSGGVYTGFPTGSPETIEVFSSNDEDGAGTQTGALTVRLEGLESNEATEYTTEDLTLNGTSAVTSTRLWYRMHRITVLTAGSGAGNLGTLTARHTSTTSNIFAVMPIGYGRSSNSMWTVPAGNTFFLTRVTIHASKGANTSTSAQVALQIRDEGSNAWRTEEYTNVTNAEGIVEDLEYPTRVSGMADIRIRVIEVGSSDTLVTAGFSGFYGLDDKVRDALLARAGL